MRKGDRRRRDILLAAEKLFYENGYERTSVQDMLNAMELSKGGFYHHFESKESVMVAICEEKTAEMYDAAIQFAHVESMSATERLNELFRRANLLSHSDENYIDMVLNAMYAQDGYMLHAKMHEVTLKKLVPVVDELIGQGMLSGEFYTRYPDLIGEQLVTLWLNLLDIVLKTTIRALDEPEEVIGVIDRINAFRTSMELILNAPYGTIRLCDAEDILKTVRRLTTIKRIQERAERKKKEEDHE